MLRRLWTFPGDSSSSRHVSRRRLAGPQPDREEVVRRHAAGKTFCDVGCMWKVNGRIAFVAEEAGATAVTGVDVMQATPEFQAEHERRSSKVRFVRGDLHEPATIAEVGPHDVVWCSGVLYHSPNPVLTLQRLRELTTELLILQTMTLPELPGVEQGLVFYPGVPDQRPLCPLGRGRGAGRCGSPEPAGPLRALVVGHLTLGAARDAARRRLRARRAVGRPVRRARDRRPA